MSAKIQIGKFENDDQEVKFNASKPATVKRVVPGMFVYVEGTPAKSDDTSWAINFEGTKVKPDRSDVNSYAIKLDHVFVRTTEGTIQPYRGEPFSELKLNVGGKVALEFQGEEPFLLVDANTRFGRSIL